MINYFKKNFLIDDKGKPKKGIQTIDEKHGKFQGST